MPNKLQAYAEQAERTARQITGSHLAWTAFLTTPQGCINTPTTSSS